MDITIEYSDEEKVLFDEVHRLKERIHILENEAYLLRKEKWEHTMENHTEGAPPIVYLVIAILCILIFVCDLIIGFENHMLHFAIAIALASAAPAVGIVFFILFFIAYRKYYYQTVQTEEGKAKAKKLNIKNYYAEEERIDSAYRKTEAELNRLKGIYDAKQKELDLLVTKRTIEVTRQREEEIRQRKEGLGAEIKVVRTEGIKPPTKENQDEAYRNEIKIIGSGDNEIRSEIGEVKAAADREGLAKPELGKTIGEKPEEKPGAKSGSSGKRRKRKKK